MIRGKRSELIDHEGNDADYVLKAIKKLENKLERIIDEYNETLAYNKKLRENLNKLRRERLVFNSVYKQLETELKTKENELDAVKQRKKEIKDEQKVKKAQEQVENLKKIIFEEKHKIEEDFKKFFHQAGQELFSKKSLTPASQSEVTQKKHQVEFSRQPTGRNQFVEDSKFFVKFSIFAKKS